MQTDEYIQELFENSVKDMPDSVKEIYQEESWQFGFHDGYRTCEREKSDGKGLPTNVSTAYRLLPVREQSERATGGEAGATLPARLVANSNEPVLPPEIKKELNEVFRLLAFAVRCWEADEPYHGLNDEICEDCNKIAKILSSNSGKTL